MRHTNIKEMAQLDNINVYLKQILLLHVTITVRTNFDCL